MNTLNRQVRTDQRVSENITLEALKAGTLNGKSFNAGKSMSMSKQDAKAVIKNNPGLFRIQID